MKCGFFDSVNGDRKYNAQDMTEYFDKLISSGVVPSTSDALQVISVPDNFVIQVNPGKAYINGHWLTLETTQNLGLSAADVTLKRCDRVVVVCDLNARVMDIRVIAGTPSDDYVIPAVSTDPNVSTLTLAYIHVDPNVTEITTDKIIDTRADTAVCGWVTGLITQVDTSTLFQQWQAAYEEQYKKMVDWVNSLESGSISLKHSHYVHTTTEDDTSEIPIMIPDYMMHGGDIEVFINGVYLSPGIDYTISEDDTMFVVLNRAVPKDNTFTIVHTRLAIGE